MRNHATAKGVSFCATLQYDGLDLVLYGWIFCENHYFGPPLGKHKFCTKLIPNSTYLSAAHNLLIFLSPYPEEQIHDCYSDRILVSASLLVPIYSLHSHRVGRFSKRRKWS